MKYHRASVNPIINSSMFPYKAAEVCLYVLLVRLRLEVTSSPGVFLILSFLSAITYVISAESLNFLCRPPSTNKAQKGETTKLGLKLGSRGIGRDKSLKSRN